LILPLGLLLIAGGVAVILTLEPKVRLIGGVFLGIGIVETLSVLTRKWRWMRLVRAMPAYNQEVSVEFLDDEVHFSSPLQKSQVKWEALKKYRQTPDGLFLMPEKGSAMYLPLHGFESPENLPVIIKRLEAVKS